MSRGVTAKTTPAATAAAHKRRVSISQLRRSSPKRLPKRLHRLIDADTAMWATRCRVLIRFPTHCDRAQRQRAARTGCPAHEKHKRCDNPENHKHRHGAQIHISPRVNRAQQCEAGHGNALPVELGRTFFQILANRHWAPCYCRRLCGWGGALLRQVAPRPRIENVAKSLPEQLPAGHAASGS